MVVGVPYALVKVEDDDPFDELLDELLDDELPDLLDPRDDEAAFSVSGFA